MTHDPHSPGLAGLLQGYTQKLYALTSERDELKQDLAAEWSLNHDEMCARKDCISFGGSDYCHHPKPASLLK